MKNPNPEKPHKIDFVEITEDVMWNPLYNFLKEIFGDKYLECADGFMFMCAVRYWDDIILYEYKHGITRKVIKLLPNGSPVKVVGEFKKEIVDGETEFNDYISEIITTSYEETFNYVFENIDKFYGADKGLFTKYSEYKVLRDKKLTELGYNVVTISDNTEFDKLTDLPKQAIK